MTVTIETTKARHQAELMALPGVVSVGIGLGSDRAPVIVVGLDHERPDTRARVPARLDGHPVEVRVLGPVRTQ